MCISIVRLQKLQSNKNCVVLQYKDGHILNYSVANVCVDWICLCRLKLSK